MENERKKGMKSFRKTFLNGIITRKLKTRFIFVFLNLDVGA